jgi:hypothetical protein
MCSWKFIQSHPYKDETGKKPKTDGIVHLQYTLLMWPVLPGTPADTLIEKYKLVQHIYECQRVCLNEASIFAN